MLENGVTTNANGRVSALKLHENNLKGRLPGDLGSLGALRELILDNRGLVCDKDGCRASSATANQFIGPIPTELTNLSHLRSLGLSGTGLTGTIPPWLGDLSQLRTLRLTGNRLMGGIPPQLGGLKNLVVLELGSNNLTVGPIPNWLAGMTHLHALGLGNSGPQTGLPTRPPSARPSLPPVQLWP